MYLTFYTLSSASVERIFSTLFGGTDKAEKCVLEQNQKKGEFFLLALKTVH